MLFDISMFPIGSGDDLSHPVAEVVDEIDQSGVDFQVSAMSTTVEGDWDEVMPVVRRAYERMAAAHDRAYLTITVDDHKKGTSRLRGAVEDIDRELGRAVPR